MSRINTNINSLISQRTLRGNNTSLGKSMERLSTGLAINRGADNPAGLIASEKLRSEKVSISAAIGNAERADQVVNIAEGGLNETQNLLTQLQGLVGQSSSEAGLSSDEKEANQLQIDQILQTIDRISSTTSFQGTKLLNGGFDFRVSAKDANVSEATVNSAKIATGTKIAVSVNVVQSAQQAGLFLSTDGALALNDNTASRFTFEVAGKNGSREFSFASGATVSDMVSQVNQFTSVTGVYASAGTSGVALKSSGYGSEEFVSVNVKSAPIGTPGTTGVYKFETTDSKTVDTAGSTAFAAASTAIRDAGQDIGATINGTTARGRGLTASVSTDALDISISLDTAAGGAQTIGTVAALTIDGGGAKFNLGPTVDMGNQVRLGLPNVAARNLGNASVGHLSDLASSGSANVVSGNVEDAQKIVNKAIDQISSLRGRLGAFQKFTVGSTLNALGVAYENTSAAEAAIRDTDFAAETANLTRNQILVQAASSILSVANSQPQNVLRLIG